VSSGKLGMETELIFKSLGVVLVTSFVILLFRQRLFSLPRRELVLVTLVHFARIFGIVGLAALMWHHILPDVPYALWLVLATLRMLVSRLPLIPNKDVVFAGLAVFLMGHDAEIADLMTMMAGLLLIAHVVVGMVFGAAELINSRKDGG
jgi:predicted permease